MSQPRVQVLIIEDSDADAKLLKRSLRRSRVARFEVEHARTFALGCDKLNGQSFDIVFLDLRLPDKSESMTIVELVALRPEVPVIVVSGHAQDWVALRAVKEGAQDFISKDEIGTENSEVGQKILHAIDRHRLLRELMEAKEQAEAANRAKSSFLAMIGHELRTPLNGILGTSQVLMGTRLTTDQKSQLRIVQTCAHSLLGVLNDLLDFTRIEADRMELEEVEFDLHDLLTTTADFFAADLAKRAVGLELDDAAGLEHWVLGDPGRIRQILLNFISNAIKFSRTGTIRARVSAAKPVGGTLFARFEVADQGIGIPEEAIERLFNPFVQGDASTTRRFGGTGLGLAISKRLATMMGGEIGVESEEGVGSRFWFEIPLGVGGLLSTPSRANVEQDPSSVLAGDLPLFSSPGARILVVEDNPINLQVAVRLIESLGFEVDAVTSGRDALESLTTFHFDAVVMDCLMPDLDGYQTTQLIRESKEIPNPKLPIIAMTANAMKDDRDHCLAAGMDDFIPKPVEVSLLYDVLLKWTHSRTHTDADHRSAFATDVEFGAPASSDGDSGPLDSRRISDLRSLDRPGVTPIIKEFGEPFLKDFPGKLQAIRKALAAGDDATVRFVAHQLVSSAGNVAATTLSEMLRPLKDLDLADDPGEERRDAALKQVEAIETEFVRVEAALRIEIGRRDAAS